MNETNLAPGSVAGTGVSGGGKTIGAETRVSNKLAEVGVFGK